MLRAVPDLDDFVSSLDLAFLQDAQIEAGPASRNQQRGHTRLIHANTDPVTSDARLGHFEQGAPNPVAIADAHIMIRQAIDCEVLAKLSVGKIVAAQLALPIPVGFRLIDQNGPLLAAVPCHISLSVAIDVEPSYLA
ncbi:hypothetical protein X740_10925 [Mesorhizobium sp. LNHC221B00]|nr:hypothetical protein X740_10925 [Mesorhizobium sp. LNHC221B00]